MTENRGNRVFEDDRVIMLSLHITLGRAICSEILQKVFELKFFPLRSDRN